MRFLLRAVASWSPLAVAITGICLLIYGTVQQNYRQSLNDPQIQMAEDAATAISAGTQPDHIVSMSVVDIGTSLAPWLAVYNAAGVPLVSSGKLNGELPQLPQGVFEAAKDGLSLFAAHHLTSGLPAGENRVTWQPEPGVRQAVVIVYYNSPNGIGYVAAGRNMREVEDREGQLGTDVLVAWLVLIAATFATQAFADYVSAKTS